MSIKKAKSGELEMKTLFSKVAENEIR